MGYRRVLLHNGNTGPITSEAAAFTKSEGPPACAGGPRHIDRAGGPKPADHSAGCAWGFSLRVFHIE